MSDLKSIESIQIAKLSEIINVLETERNSAILSEKEAKAELALVMSEIDNRAAKAAKQIWNIERSMLLNKIDRLEKEIRKAKRR